MREHWKSKAIYNTYKMMLRVDERLLLARSATLHGKAVSTSTGEAHLFVFECSRKEDTRNQICRYNPIGSKIPRILQKKIWIKKIKKISEFYFSYSTFREHSTVKNS